MNLKYVKRIATQNIVSPYGLALVSYAIFIFAWVFPPNAYQQFVHEPDLMFLDPLTFALYTACVLAFMLGVRAERLIRPARGRDNSGVGMRSPAFYLFIPMFVGMVCCSILLSLVGAKFDLVALLVSQQGSVIKQSLHGSANPAGNWELSLLGLTAVLWWAWYRSRQIRLTGVLKRMFYFTFAAGVILDVMTCIATVDRTSLMPLIAGLAVIHTARKVKAVRLGRVMTFGFFSAALVIGLFMLMSMLRGVTTLDLALTGLLGYTIVSYNRLAALVLGVMQYQYGGRFAYLFPYLLDANKLDSIFGFQKMFGWPNGAELWRSEFTSTMSAGLNPAFIWSGAFGYVFSDLRWLTPLYVMFVGAFAGYFWRKFTEGRTMGLVLYPWVAFCVLFWLGWNTLFVNYIVPITAVGVMLTVWDAQFLRRPVVVTQSEHPNLARRMVPHSAA